MEAVVMNEQDSFLSMFNLDDEALEIINGNGLFDAWWYNHGKHHREVISLGEFKPKFEAGQVENFVYYREAGVVFNTLVPACHSNFMAGMYNLHMLKKGMSLRQTSEAYKDRPCLTNMFCGKWDGQDKYIQEGLGTYQSSCGRDMYVHQNMVLDGQERMVFSGVPRNVVNW